MYVSLSRDGDDYHDDNDDDLDDKGTKFDFVSLPQNLFFSYLLF
jgi:hypothetical protein